MTERTAVHVVEQNIKVSFSSVNHRLCFTQTEKPIRKPRGKSGRNLFQITLPGSDEI